MRNGIRGTSGPVPDRTDLPGRSERGAATAGTTTFRLWVRQFPSAWDFYVLSVGLGPLVEHGQKLVAFDVEVRQ